MQGNRVISTAVLFLLIGAALPAFAQKGEEKGGGGEKAQPAQHAAQAQHAQPAQHQAQPQRAQQTQHQAAPQRAQRAQPQRAQQTQHQAQPQRTQQARQAAPQHAQQAQPQRAQQAQQSRAPRQQAVATNRGGGGQYGRITNASYNSHFGHEHSFHMGHPQFIGGYNRFQYGGYWFGYNQGWPIGWGYNDNVYVVYEDGGYFMYDLMHPGIHISLNIF